MSQEKKATDYTTGTYFIHPKLMEEMRQSQRQKHQLAKEQREALPEQLPDSVAQKTSQDTPNKQTDDRAKQSVPKLTDTSASQTNTPPARPKQ